jgi:hypothetical protein
MSDAVGYFKSHCIEIVFGYGCMKNKIIDHVIELMSYSTTQPSTEESNEPRHSMPSKKYKSNYAPSY